MPRSASVACGTVIFMTSAVEDLLARHVAEGTIPGGVALLGRDQPEVGAAGVARVGGPPMRADAIMRIQSMTKPITAVAALRLVEAGRVDLDSSAEQWLPELADRRVLVDPGAALDNTVPAVRPLTLRHLLTNTSGYGMLFADTPLHQAMIDNGTEAGWEPPAIGADAWLARLAELPLAFQPGEGWRYHHSFAVLGIMLARITGRPLGDHLEDDLFGPLGMTDTAQWVPEGKLDRLPAAYRHTDDRLVELEPAGGGRHAGPPPFDVSHGDLVSTVRDFARFLRALEEGLPGGRPLISAEHRRQLTGDQVPDESKTDEDFFPGFWQQTGWGFGVGVQLAGPRKGRYGWTGGAGTDFFVDPDGTVGILFTQVEMGERMFGLVEEFQGLADATEDLS
jgi:CubicO group peptidase (beta-lactamase class C family)